MKQRKRVSIGLMTALAVFCSSVGVVYVRAQEVAGNPFGATVGEALDRRPIWERPTLSFYGTPGLIDMPSAHMMLDGDISLTSGYAGGSLRNTLTFQILPRLTGSFRYSVIEGFDGPINRYDRSFDISYLLAEETARRPALAIGLRDFGGTGIYAGEYLVATKTFNRLRVTGGLGWGRLASHNGFDNPLGLLGARFDTRPTGETDISQTGQLDTGQWFRGDAALFGGVQYQVNDRLVLTAEYSSDAYEAESARTDFDPRSPLNFGATYRFRNGTDLTASWLYGESAGIFVSHTLNPTRTRYPGGLESSGPPILPRDRARALGWGDIAHDRSERDRLIERARQALAAEGLELRALQLTGPDHVTLQVVNARYNAVPQAYGRAARVMTNLLPPEIDTLTIVTEFQGMELSAVTLRRDDLEELEYDYDGAWKIYSRAEIEDGAGRALPRGAQLPRDALGFRYDLGTYARPAYFDPDNPLRLDFGLELDLAYVPTPGLQLSARLRQPLAGNLDQATRTSNSVLPHVRSDANLYDRESDLEINHLTADYFFRPGADLYGRVTAGYLESMYAGVSTEVLWKPVTGPWALGGELNYAVQRDFDMLLGLQDYDIVTGHLSAYYDFGNGFLGQVDAGRYLAGDWGATFSMDREFANGIQVGAFFTLTDVSADEFGEGSFDKGIRFTIPLSQISGEPSRTGFGQTIRPVTRDGGARLNVRNRLYGVVRGYHDPELREDWGKFWR